MVLCSDNERNAYIYGSISVAIVSLLSLAGAAVIPLFRLKSRHRWLQFFVALAIASLAGDALLHLIPTVLGAHGHVEERCETVEQQAARLAREKAGLPASEEHDSHEGHDHRRKRQDHDDHDHDHDHDDDHDEDEKEKGGLSAHEDDEHEFEPGSQKDPHAGHDHSEAKLHMLRMVVIFASVYALYLFETVAYNLGGHNHSHGQRQPDDIELTPATSSTADMPNDDYRKTSKKGSSNGVVPKSYSPTPGNFDNGHYATPNQVEGYQRPHFGSGFNPHDIWAAKWYWMYPYAYHDPAYDLRMEMHRQRAMMNNNQHLPGKRHRPEVGRRVSTEPRLNRLSSHPRIEEIETGSTLPRSATFPKMSQQETTKAKMSMSGKSQAELNQPDLCLGFKPIAIMILVGDAVHNFADGLAIGVTFMAGMPSGIATSIAVAFHELPHEIGDFAVLIDSGLSVCKALAMNFISALTAFAGLYLGIYLGDNEDAKPWLLSIAAGMFLYIAWVDMMAHMKEMMSQSEDHWCISFFVQNLGILIGFAIIFLLGWYEDAIHESLQTALHKSLD